MCFMFLTGGLPTDSPSPKIEKGSYSERYPFPDWRGNVTARKLIKKKQTVIFFSILYPPNIPNIKLISIKLYFIKA